MACRLVDSSFLFMRPQQSSIQNHKFFSLNPLGMQHLVDDPSNEYLAALCTTIRCINHPQKYYEKVIRNAINRPGTDENTVPQVIIARAEVDFKEIDEQYYKRNNVILDGAVAKDTSGDYNDFLLILLENED